MHGQSATDKRTHRHTLHTRTPNINNSDEQKKIPINVFYLHLYIQNISINESRDDNNNDGDDDDECDYKDK